MFRSAENEFMAIHRLWNSRGHVNNIVNRNAEARSSTKPGGKGKRQRTHWRRLLGKHTLFITIFIMSRDTEATALGTVIPTKLILSVTNDYLGFKLRRIFILCIPLCYRITAHRDHLQLSTVTSLFTHNVSETGFCLSLQVELIQFGPIDRACLVSGH
jgi:hypothetical protein